MQENKIPTAPNATTQHVGLDQIKQLSLVMDLWLSPNNIYHPGYKIAEKINEIIDKVNLLIALKNSEL